MPSLVPSRLATHQATKCGPRPAPDITGVLMTISRPNGASENSHKRNRTSIELRILSLETEKIWKQNHIITSKKKKPNIQKWKRPIPTSNFFYQNIPSFFQVFQLMEPLFCQKTTTQGRLRHQQLILESRSCGFHCGERPMAKRILPNAGRATGSMRKYHLRLQVRNIHR